MSLPPGFIEELRTRVSLVALAGRKVTWDARKTNRARGDWWAPCPFHQEKSASFHVDEGKGVYYCFGCQASGDAVSFVRETEGLSFLDAVAVLAREAGMTLPAPDPQARRQADRRGALVAVMEQAVRWFRRQLATSDGAPARAYLEGRGLTVPAQERFSIGFAPDRRQGLLRHLADAGVDEEMALAAGLVARPEGGGAAYDRFRGRIIFPIRDVRGDCIALGGRALDPGARAKYLNSPETEIFHKGRVLYNLGPAREAAARGAALIVAEGYTDVIALSEAGFGAAVAPLGTAITEDQLRLMWKIAPEPVIMLDGDAAGQRAAGRLIDLALPLLEPGKGLRFCTLPGGVDPDEFLRAQGPAALAAAIEGAEPMVDLLWRRETAGRDFDSPERRAGLEKALMAAAGRIPDAMVARAYRQALGERLRAAFRPAPGAPAGRRGDGRGPARGQAGAPPRGFVFGAPAQARPETRASLLAQADSHVGDRVREAVILAILVTHPALVDEFAADLERLDPADPDHRAIAAALLRHAGPDEADRARLAAALRAEAGAALEKLLALGHVRSAPPVRNRDDTDLARRCLGDVFARVSSDRGWAREVAEAEQDIAAHADEGVTWRLEQAASARHRAGRGALEETDPDEDRDALVRSLRGLIEAEVWKKGKTRG